MFLTWCRERGIDEVVEITESSVEGFRRYLFHYRNARSGKALKFCTQSSYLSAVRHWLDWLCNENWLRSNPAEHIELPKEEQRLPASHLTLSEVESLINAPDLTAGVGLRDRAILETFYSTGMRRSELANLQQYDLDAERRLITIRQGKGRKDRVVPLGKRALDWITKYQSDVRPKLLDEPTDSDTFTAALQRRRPRRPAVLHGPDRSIEIAGTCNYGSNPEHSITDPEHWKSKLKPRVSMGCA
jgi:integrase/recombinase XerD